MKPIRVLANAADVVNLLADRGPLTLPEISDQLGLPRPSTYRLLEGLEAICLVRTTADSHIDLDLRWLHLADAAGAGMSEWSAAGEVLESLVERTGQTAFLSVPRNNRSVCIRWMPGRGIGVLALKPGRSLPFHAGAAGRILLAYTVEDLDAYFQAASPEEFTPNTLVTEQQLRNDIARTLRQGFVHSDEDVTVGIGALGVPVTAADNLARGCISLGGLAGEIGDRRQEFVAELRRAAAHLART